MPRIPGPSDVQTTRAERLPALQNAGAPGKVFQHIGDIAEQLYQRRQQAEDVGFMANLATQAEPEFTRIFEQNKINALDGEEDFPSLLNKSFDQATEKILDSSKKQGFRPSQDAIQQARLRFANLKGSFLTKGIVYENNARIEKLSTEIDTAVDGFASLAFSDPESYELRFEDANALLSGSAGLMSPESISEKRQMANRQIAISTINGFIESNPEKAINILNDPEHRITKALDAEDLLKLQPAAEQEDRIEKAYVLGREAVDKSKSLGEVYKNIEKIEDKKLREQARTVARDFYGQRVAVENEKKAGQEALKSTSNRENKAYLEALQNGYTISKEERKRVYDLAQSAGTLDQLLIDEDRERDLWEIAIQPRAVQDKIINELSKVETVEGATRHRRALEKRDQIEEMARDDGYTLGIRQGLIQEIPLDLNDPTTFAARAEQANKLTAHFGVRVSPFSDIEVGNIANSLSSKTIDEKLVLVNRINSMGRASTRAWEQMAKKNAITFAYAGAISEMSPDVSMAVLKGEDLLRRGNAAGLPVEDYLPAFDKYVKDVYSGENRQAVREASLAAYASIYGSQYNDENFKEILKKITGGIVEINGQHTELPMGVKERDFENYVDYFSPDAVKAFGGVFGASNERAAELIRESKWIAKSSNLYAISHPEYGPLFKPDGKPLYLEYREEFKYASPKAKTKFEPIYYRP